MATHDPDLLLDAAGKLFREKSFAATTVREIAGEAEVLPGSLHYRFSTKEELLVALMERGMRRALERVQQAIAVTDDPVERLRRAVTAHLTLLVSGAPDVYVLLYEMRSLSPADSEKIGALRGTYEAFWDGLLYAALGAGRLRPDQDLRLVRMGILGCLNWSAQWYRREEQRTPTQIAEAFWELLSNGMLQPVRGDEDA